MLQVENLKSTIDDKAKGFAEMIAIYEQELNGKDADLTKSAEDIKTLRKSLDNLELRNNEQAKRKRFAVLALQDSMLNVKLVFSDNEEAYVMFKQLHTNEIANLNQTISELEASAKEWAQYRDQMSSDLNRLEQDLAISQQTNQDIECRLAVTNKELNHLIENLEGEKTALVLELKDANESKR